MEHNITATHFQNLEVEAIKTTFRATSFQYAATQALHDGGRPDFITAREYRLLLPDVLTANLHLATEEIKRILGCESLVFTAREAEALAQSRTGKLQTESLLTQHKMNELCRQRDAVPHRHIWQYRISRVMLPLIIVLAIADVGLSIGSFTVVFSFVQALMLSIAVGGVIVSAHPLASWVRKAPHPTQGRNRLLTILSAALIFYSMVGIMRAEAMASQINIAVDAQDTDTSSYMSAVSLAIISYVLFALSLVLAIVFWLSPKARKSAAQFISLDKEITILTDTLQQLVKEQGNLERSVVEKKTAARNVFYYQEHSIKELESTTVAAIVEYKKVFAQRRGMVPDFFMNTGSHYSTSYTQNIE